MSTRSHEIEYISPEKPTGAGSDLPDLSGRILLVLLEAAPGPNVRRNRYVGGGMGNAVVFFVFLGICGKAACTCASADAARHVVHPVGQENDGPDSWKLSGVNLLSAEERKSYRASPDLDDMFEPGRGWLTKASDPSHGSPGALPPTGDPPRPPLPTCMPHGLGP